VILEVRSAVKLELRRVVVAKAIASSRKAEKMTSQLIYMSLQQTAGFTILPARIRPTAGRYTPSACLLFQHAMFNGVRKMYVHQQATVCLYGDLTATTSLFYTSCGTGQETSPAAWSSPGNNRYKCRFVFAYINLVNKAKLFLACRKHTSKLTKSPQTHLEIRKPPCHLGYQQQTGNTQSTVRIRRGLLLL
jgi:hypothetical protein